MISLLSKGLTGIFSSIIWKHQFFGTQPFLWPALTSIYDYWKNHSLDHTDLCQLDFPGGSVGKEAACNAGDMGSISGFGRSPGEGNGYTQYFCLENSMDRGDWQATAHGVAKSWTRLSNMSLVSKVMSQLFNRLYRCFTLSCELCFHSHLKGKHWHCQANSLLLSHQRSPGEPGRLQGTGSQRVGPD